MKIQKWALALLTLVACDLDPAVVGAPTPTPAPTPVAEVPVDDVTRAARAADAIDRNPAHAVAILEDHGFTPDAFEAVMYEIAEDPEKTAAYEAARR